ncbi:hypothetical protein 162275540 [Organic Lake phycodnavirus]|nr:hypothetical protein 162275540 [Organic Lake phycodnavirus]
MRFILIFKININLWNLKIMKSGFYYLSKLTKTPIYVVHLNYIDNKIEVIDRFFILEQPFDEVKNKCISIYKSLNKVPFWTNI